MIKGWQTTTLGDACRFIDYRGKTPEKTTSGLRLITAKNVKMGYLQRTPMEYVAPESYDDWMTRGIPKMGDVLFTTEAPLANVAQLDTDEKVVFAQRIIVLQPSANNLDRTFLKYLLLSDVAQNRILEQGTGATVQGIKASLLKTIPIEVPALAEQQRIVGLLDEAFAGLATAKANAEKNLQNARALFESHLQSVFTQRGPGWVEKSLGEMCEMYQPKTIGTKDLVPDGPYPVFGANGVIGRYDKFNHEEPQLLVTCRGATCGSVNISAPNSWITGNAMVVRPKDDALDLHFLEFVFRGGIDISAAITGAAQPQITRTNLSPLLIRYPKSVTEQTRLAEKFEALTEETQRLARLYERKHAALEALKKSLLHQAFTGKL